MLYGDGSRLAQTPRQQQTGKSAMHKVKTLIQELSDDEDDNNINSLTLAPDELHAPWRRDFHGYLNSKDQLGNISIIEWWGVHVSFNFSMQVSDYATYSGTQLIMMSGHPSRVICCQLWHHQFPVNVSFRLQES